MTRDDAKEYLLNMFDSIGTTAVEYWTQADADKMRNAVETLCEALDRVPTADVQPEQRWILCSEQMPEINKEVLATCENARGKRYVMEAQWSGERWVSVWDDYKMPGTVQKYIAWQYMPQSYKD